MADSGTAGRQALLFTGGLVIGGAVAFGAAYGAARYYVNKLEAQAEQPQPQPSGAKRTASRYVCGGIVRAHLPSQRESDALRGRRVCTTSPGGVNVAALLSPPGLTPTTAPMHVGGAWQVLAKRRRRHA